MKSKKQAAIPGRTRSAVVSGRDGSDQGSFDRVVPSGADSGRSCRKCGCTEDRACLEFDSTGYAHACHWWEDDLCSACGPEVPSAGFRSGRLNTSNSHRQRYLKVPQLAGMVARPRR